MLVQQIHDLFRRCLEVCRMWFWHHFWTHQFVPQSNLSQECHHMTGHTEKKDTVFGSGDEGSKLSMLGMTGQRPQPPWDVTGQRMQPPSDGNHRTAAKAKEESPNIVDSGWRNESAPKESCSFKHDISKEGKGKSKRDRRPSSPSPRPRSQSKDNRDRKGAAKGNTERHQSMRPNELCVLAIWKGKCTRPSCDCWYPLEYVKHKNGWRL